MSWKKACFSFAKDLLCSFPSAVQVIDITFRGDPLQDVKRSKGGGRGSLETHDDTVGFLIMGYIDHILHDKGCAVVYVLCIEKVEDDYFVVPDVGANGANQLVG